MARNLELLNNITIVSNEAEINVYTAKYRKNSKDSNYCISWPENENEYIKGLLINDLKQYSKYQAVDFDPQNKKNDTYEVICDQALLSIWNSIMNLIEEHLDFKDNHGTETLRNCNLDIYEMLYNKKKYYLCCKSQTAYNAFKHKWAFMKANDEVQRVDNSKWFTLSDKIDFVVELECDIITVYVFNKKSFIHFFDYYTYMKDLVCKKIPEIRKWTFLDSTDLIVDKINQKNVFLPLGRVVDDAAYLEAVRKIKPQVLKQRLLNKCKRSFSERDFNGNKLIVNINSLSKIMKMIAKQYRYNVFTDTAEESE